MINKFFNSEIKSVNAKDRTVEHFITVEVIDRDNEIVRVDGIDLEKYRDNPVVLWAHGYDFHRGMMPIAKNIKLTKVDNEKKGIHAITQFYDDEFSKNLFKMYKDGFLKTWSIGFVPKQERITDEDGHGIFPMVELLEYSSVPIPANPEAKAKGYLSERDIKFWEIAQRFKLGEKEFLTECYHELLTEHSKLNDEANTMRVALQDMTHQRNEFIDKLREAVGKELPAEDYAVMQKALPVMLKIFKFGDVAEQMIGTETPKNNESLLSKWAKGLLERGK